MNAWYFTFGQAHERIIDGQVFDKDTVVVVEADSYLGAREKFVSVFGQKWSHQHGEEIYDSLHFYPKGIVDMPHVETLPEHEKEKDEQTQPRFRRHEC